MIPLKRVVTRHLSTRIDWAYIELGRTISVIYWLAIGIIGSTIIMLLFRGWQGWKTWKGWKKTLKEGQGGFVEDGQSQRASDKQETEV